MVSWFSAIQTSTVVPGWAEYISYTSPPTSGVKSYIFSRMRSNTPTEMSCFDRLPRFSSRIADSVSYRSVIRRSAEASMLMIPRRGTYTPRSRYRCKMAVLMAWKPVLPVA